MKYSITEIAILLEAAGLKAGIDAFDKVGCKKLADDINKHREQSPHQVKLSARYIRDTICKEVFQYSPGDPDLIGLGQEHIETICYYLNYSSFAAFQRSYISWKEKLNTLKPNLSYFPVLHNPVVCQLPEELRGILEKSRLEYEILVLDENTSLNDKVQKALLVIALVNNQLKLTEADHKFLSKLEEETTLLFYVNCTQEELEVDSEEQWKKEKLASDQELLLILTLVKLHLSKENPSGRKTKNTTGTPPNSPNIHTLIMGNSKIKAEYFSNQDMYITVNKEKKK